MSNVIDALKRLERWGSEDSKATQKLRDAASSLAAHISTLVPSDTELPRGYSARQYGNAASLYLWEPDDNDWASVAHTRDNALDFAEDIATGLLDELAAWLEQRTGESDGAAATLRRAAEALKPE